MSSGRMIDYEALAQDAMRGVVRTVLARTAKSGLPGDHHFYISFDTQHPGVVLSKRLREKYPEEMTIVLQHRFWDLNVTEDRFEVKLTFDGIPERLVVPFAAVKIFFDPSVRYGLQFEAPDFSPEGLEHAQVSGDDDIVPERPQPTTLRTSTKSSAERKLAPRAPRKTRPERTAEPVGSQEPADQQSAPSKAPAVSEAAPRDSGDEPTSPGSAPQGAEIVRLDAFRKK